MAEIAAAAWGIEEAISTTVQVGVAAYMVTKPTMPLKATFKQIATSSDDSTRLSLARSAHSLNIVGNKAYIFGGQTAADKLASNDIHVVTLASADKPEPDYSVLPAVPDGEGGAVPAARRKHAACAFNVCVAVFGGLDEGGETLDERTLWLFNTGKSAWEVLEPKDVEAARPGPRSGASLFNDKNNLVLYGGQSSTGEALRDVWRFDYVESSWTQLPDAPVSTTNAALTNGILHLITSTDSVSSDVHILRLSVKEPEQPSGHTIPFPTNALTPGPRPRAGGGLLPVSTGHGRLYLAYLFGARQTASEATSTPPETSEQADPPYWSDMWTYQLPSSSPEARPTTSISEAIKPAKIKDAIRNALGYDSGGHSWAEVEVLPPTDLDASAGKVHPGPRGFFGCDVMEDQRSVVIWGGINAKGETEGDGWIIKLE